MGNDNSNKENKTKLKKPKNTPTKKQEKTKTILKQNKKTLNVINPAFLSRFCV